MEVFSAYTAPLNLITFVLMLFLRQCQADTFEPVYSCGRVNDVFCRRQRLYNECRCFRGSCLQIKVGYRDIGRRNSFYKRLELIMIQRYESHRDLNFSCKQVNYSVSAQHHLGIWSFSVNITNLIPKIFIYPVFDIKSSYCQG
nr:MAG TPA: hypothetical protein [Caudoviricetes sp.]